MSMIRSTRVPLLATLVLVASCSTPSTPKALPPQTMAPIPPETEEPISNSDEYREPLPEVSVEPPPACGSCRRTRASM